MNYKIYTKNLPNYIKKQLPDLFDWTSDSILFSPQYENKRPSSIVLVVYNENPKDVIGAICLTLGSPTKYDQFGKPYFNLYIERMEVNPKYKRQGYGTQIFHLVMNIYGDMLEKVSLTHREYDKNVSYRFWRSQGFRHKGSGSYMELKKRTSHLRSFFYFL